MVCPAIRLAHAAALPFAQGGVGAGAARGLQEAEGDMCVGGGEEPGDTGRVVEAVCEGVGGEDGAPGAGGEEGGCDGGVGIEVAGCEGVGC